MKDWFDGLENRERQFVLAAAAAVVVALLYFGIWSPLDARHRALGQEVESWQAMLVELQALRPALARGATGTGNNDAARQSPLIVVERSLESRDLLRYRTRSQPVSSNGIRVEFEDVAFDDLVLWLGDLSNSHGMHVQAGTFSGGTRAGPGRVNVSLTLERA